jgi:hypothetical protein
VWSPEKSRWLVEIRYPDGSRCRKRLRREREALRLWAAEQAKIENGTWDERAARNIIVAVAFDQYRNYSKVQHRSYYSYVDPSLTLWETTSRTSDAAGEDRLAAGASRIVWLCRTPCGV